VVVIDRDPQFRDRRDDRRADVRRTGSAGLDNAVDMCVERIERDVRIDTVDNVERTASGWQVSGSIFNGARFDCRIGNDGRIDAIDYDGTFGVSSVGAADGQWDDQSYANARAGVGGTVRPDLAVQETTARGGLAVAPTPARAASASALPAYPGGPIPGEDIPKRSTRQPAAKALRARPNNSAGPIPSGWPRCAGQSRRQRRRPMRPRRAGPTKVR
jgi:hypothetical protein